ncbi:hypothetical protein K458DRAFT_8885 [Lentithecium fluviatile CBS 122367]|uniref:Uncharacterized protein n=1 Tax=Lentithecium fluviatile CBS 122367 TaxID=1168545 RepID=A0A6G1JN64_9PLEO|nr:hypothetical protein K458DRAFT_8885 [Lentithecium fluviatile CBS 122367]
MPPNRTPRDPNALEFTDDDLLTYSDMVSAGEQKWRVVCVGGSSEISEWEEESSSAEGEGCGRRGRRGRGGVERGERGGDGGGDNDDDDDDDEGMRGESKGKEKGMLAMVGEYAATALDVTKGFVRRIGK